MQNEVLLVSGQVPDYVSNSLPQVLRIPSGLAILELQGTINIPALNFRAEVENATNEGCEDSYVEGPKFGLKPGSSKGLSIGRLFFPDYDEKDTSETEWMKKVYLYIGSHQKLTGEVVKLSKAIAVIQKKKSDTKDKSSMIDETCVQLEIVDIIKYKILFANRPEPVSNQSSYH
ncbi:putative sister chromatid cohesion protein ctf8 [Erysiphe neolycopersici]|uniref:Putative sister chromatid cohesion protein ctf8 n=1 Tax=Erysiphe neolycopersici TaxID=212602 RepID=A0A420I203_9PEZI|nr:putative sister chromatid cohesion protein ctf8 [Erysiphe neolycopersici]